MKKSLFTVAVGACVILAGEVSAQVKEKEFKDWAVYTTSLEGNKTCYMASFPKSKTGNYSKRDEPYFLVTRLSDAVHEVSTSSGYTYKSGSEVKLHIGDKRYSMFTEGELSWASDSAADQQIIEAMKKGNSMTVNGTSAKGTYSVDKYSLSGVSDAFGYMQSLCR